MEAILADQTALAACPSWCRAHMGSGSETTHISPDRIIAVQSPHASTERTEVYVALEQEVGAELTAVRLSGASDSPMTAAQAFQVGSALISAAFAALTGNEVAS